MKIEDCQRAVDLHRALLRIAKVRRAFERDAELNLEIIALEGDEDGGTHKASVLMPSSLASLVLDPLEKNLRNELDGLGITHQQSTKPEN